MERVARSRSSPRRCDWADLIGSRRLFVTEVLPPGACAGLYRHGIHFCFLGFVAIPLPDPS